MEFEGWPTELKLFFFSEANSHNICISLGKFIYVWQLTDFLNYFFPSKRGKMFKLKEVARIKALEYFLLFN
jgi:hypothetical protein